MRASTVFSFSEKEDKERWLIVTTAAAWCDSIRAKCFGDTLLLRCMLCVCFVYAEAISQACGVQAQDYSRP